MRKSRNKPKDLIYVPRSIFWRVKRIGVAQEITVNNYTYKGKKHSHHTMTDEQGARMSCSTVVFEDSFAIKSHGKLFGRPDATVIYVEYQHWLRQGIWYALNAIEAPFWYLLEHVAFWLLGGKKLSREFAEDREPRSWRFNLWQRVSRWRFKVSLTRLVDHRWYRPVYCLVPPKIRR